ncbi:electron transfer flavoprotein subunit beta/FixA family protein [Alcaligenaceae bacterium]|nr:electron transfer flavoprotein subunit beta/FixA family protein [Alcaligenaceae bacterium]
MKILVAVKRVVDPNVRINIRPGSSAIDTAGLKTCINPFDEVAVEQAVRMKEAGSATEVVLVSVDSQAAKETLRSGLAMGADRAILVETQQAGLDSLGAAKLLAEAIRKESPDLVLLGKQSVDADAAQCGPMLAALLGWPQATFVAEMREEGGLLTVIRDAELGAETLRMRLPAVVTADLRLAEPRYTTLPHVMAARRKPMETIPADQLLPSGTLAPRLTMLGAAPAEAHREIRLLPDAAALVARLREDAKVFLEEQV